jgi:predicted transglutaminase-like cysteine proteinase
MITSSRIGGLLIALTVVFASAGAAVPAPAPTASMIVGSITSQPIGHYEFCQQYPDECNVRSKVSPAPRLTEAGWSAVEAINIIVNTTITPMTDMEVYGREEVWAYPVDAGDCEDFALLKRKQLLQRGFSPADVLMTVVRKPDGEGHAVLTLRTAQGDYILDNLDTKIKLWSDTPYTYLKRQASFNTGRWVTIENGKDMVVGSVR